MAKATLSSNNNMIEVTSDIARVTSKTINSVIESKEKNLSQNTLASPDTSDSQLLVMQGANQESSSKNIISPAEAPQVKEGELKSTESTSSFVKTISNNIVMSSKKSKLAGLPPEIARMLK